MKPPRLLLADDHTIVVEGLCRILKPEFEIVGTVQDGRALVAAAEKLRPDVIVVDISMPLLNGLEAVRQMQKANIKAKIIFLTMHSEVEFCAAAFRAGASGYILKQSAAEELTRAIREILEERIYVSPLIAKDLLHSFMEDARQRERPSVQLTPRQREVLQLIAEGRSMKEIAGILNISPRTVEFHKYNVMEVLSLRTTAELTKYAIKHGIVPA